jgi:hypothetical protein
MPKPLAVQEVAMVSFGTTMAPARLLDGVRVVRVADLATQLRKSTPVEVLNKLFTTDELLSEALAGGKVALLSYRQERGTNNVSSSDAAAYAHLTLDGDAFRGLIASAKRLGVDSLWADAWCYREPGQYDHAHFCRVLSSVVSGIDAVVWLPRSKHGSRAEYAYRLFCTFEAACVELRSLPVAVAGAGPSAFQTRLRRFGSFTPALRADGTLDTLCRLNAAFYFAVVGATFYVTSQLLWGLESLHVCDGNWTVVASKCKHRTDAAEEGFGTMIVFVFSLPMTWLAVRATIGQQVRLAKNATCVLRIMQRASRDRSSRAHDTVQRKSVLVRLGLRRNLPWLPAYDRRDALVVAALLGQLNPDDALDAVERRALAFSAYTAARQSPSPGDCTARSSTLRAWLHEKSIALETTSTRKGDADAEVGNSSATLLGQTTWLDELPEPNGLAEENCIPLTVLRKFGWVHATSVVGGALITPLGAICTHINARGVWSVGVGAVALEPLQLANVCVAIFLADGCLNLGMFIAYLWVDSLAHPFDGMGTVYMVQTFLVGGYALALFAADAVTLSADARNWRASRRLPLPFVVLSSAKQNAMVLMCLVGIATSQVWLLFIYITKTLQPNEAEVPWRQPSHRFRIIQYVLSILFFGMYEIPLAVANLVGGAWRWGHLAANQQVLG